MPSPARPALATLALLGHAVLCAAFRVPADLARRLESDLAPGFRFNRSGAAREVSVRDLLEETEHLEEILPRALRLVALEMAVQCPSELGSNEDADLVEKLRSSTTCCSLALEEIGLVEGGLSRTTLHFELAGKAVQMRLLSDPADPVASSQLESISPSPCGDGEEDTKDGGDGHAVNVNLHSEVVQQAKDAIEAHLRHLCPEADPALAKVSKVHLAWTQIVEGTEVNLVLELASGAMHRIQALIDLDGSISSVQWPKTVPGSDVCGILRVSSLPEASLQEVAAMVREREGGGHGNLSDATWTTQVRFGHHGKGGHFKELDYAVPVASLSELQARSWDADKGSDKKEYDWRSAHPTCFPSADAGVRSQGSCGSCWAFASLGAAGDRHCLANPDSMLTRKGLRRTLSVQHLLSCKFLDGCDGGHSYMVYKAMLSGLKLTHTDEYPYEARCFKDGDGVVEDWGAFQCRAFRRYDDNDPKKPCGCIDETKRPSSQPTCKEDKADLGRFGLADFKRIPSPGERRAFFGSAKYSNAEIVRLIQDEIFSAGPVYASIDVYACFQRFVRRRGGGRKVYRRETDSNYTGGHAMVVVGWGVSEGQDYWTLRNSWGSSWGTAGHYRHIRGINDCRIEEGIVYPVVKKVDWLYELDVNPIGVKVADVSEQGWLGPYNQRRVWRLELQCSGACRALSAVLPTASGEAEKDVNGKCCCDGENYHPPRCHFIQPARLRETSWLTQVFFAPGPFCARYNFGRGLAPTNERYESRGAEDCPVQPNGEEPGMRLEIKNAAPDRLVVDINLNAYASLRGRHELKVHAAAENSLVEVSRTFEVVIDERSSKISVKKLIRFSHINHEIKTVSEPYRERSFFGGEWRYRQHHILEVAAACSSKCHGGTATFTNLDGRYHPRPELVLKAQNLSAGPNTLIFQARVDAYPPGEYTLKIAANSDSGPLPSVQHNIEIPELYKDQGSDWLPVKILSVSSDVQSQGGGFFRPTTYFQVLSIKCTKACSLVDFHLADRSLGVSTAQGTAMQEPGKADNQVLVYFRLGRRMQIGSSAEAALAVAGASSRDVANSSFAITLGKQDKFRW